MISSNVALPDGDISTLITRRSRRRVAAAEEAKKKKKKKVGKGAKSLSMISFGDEAEEEEEAITESGLGKIKSAHDLVKV